MTLKILLLSLLIFANTSPLRVKDKQWGEIIVDLIEKEHPVSAGVKMKVSVLCLNQKGTKAKPQKTELIETQICQFDKLVIDEKKHVATLSYFLKGKTSNASDNPCTEVWAREFNLAQICESWKK